jgi:hypothetical protein
VRLQPKQLVTGPYLWRARLNRNKRGASSKEFVNRSVALGVPTAGRDGFVTDLRNEAQTIMSRENPVKLLGRKNHPEDIGGDFESYKIEIFLDSWAPVTFSNTTTTQPSYETIIPSPANELSKIHQLARGSNPNPEDQTALTAHIKGFVPNAFTSNEMDVWGTQVINSVIPSNPVADLSTTLAELASEGKFFENPLKDSATPSDRYLNYQFGISPTVGFAQDFRKAVKNRDAIIDQYERDAGKRVRRKFDVPPVITTSKSTRSSASLYGLGLGPASSRISSNGICTVTTKTTVWKSFSGAFTYYIPKREGGLGELDRLDKLYGVNPLNNLTGTGWELTPYSWLVDYFASSGAYNRNIDAFRGDSLVMPYAYVMFTTVKDVEYSWTGNVRFGSSQVSRTYGGRVVSTTLQRRHATPYGFGLSDSDLTDKQWSILAALGIGRVSKWL